MKTYQSKTNVFQKKTEVHPKDVEVIALWENTGKLRLLVSLQESLRGQVKK